MKRLLDTNAYTALRRGHVPTAVIVRGSEEVIVSLVVIGELLFGFFHGSRYAENLLGLDEFLGSPYVRVPEVTRATADRFGRISAHLKQQGTPIPTNDVWIAAQAMELGAEVVTFDGHFASVPGLVVVRMHWS